MTLDEIIFKFCDNIKIIIRQLEKLERKQVKANMAIIYIYKMPFWQPMEDVKGIFYTE